jgi:ankyrin repeat protein
MDTKKRVVLSFVIKISCIIFCFFLIRMHVSRGAMTPMDQILFNQDKSLADVEYALKQGARLDTRDEYGRTSLMLAVLNDDVDRVKLLIKYGASINDIATNDGYKNGYTALHYAILKGSAPAGRANIKFLLRSGADPRIQSNIGREAPLHLITELGDNGDRMEILSALMQHGADINVQRSDGYAHLHIIVQQRNTEWTTMLMGLFGSLLNFEIRNADHLTPLGLGDQLGYTETTDIMRQKIIIPGIKNDNPDSNGLTGLMLAVISNNKELIRQLLDLKRNINFKSVNEFGYTPAHVAIYEQDVGLLDMLISNGADVTSVLDAQGMPAFQIIEYLRDPAMRAQMVSTCMKHGININCTDNKNNTILHYIVRNDDLVLAEFLMKQYSKLINVNAKNNEYDTPMSLAHALNHTQMIKILSGNSGK